MASLFTLLVLSNLQDLHNSIVPFQNATAWHDSPISRISFSLSIFTKDITSMLPGSFHSHWMLSMTKEHHSLLIIRSVPRFLKRFYVVSASLLWNVDVPWQTCQGKYTSASRDMPRWSYFGQNRRPVLIPGESTSSRMQWINCSLHSALPETRLNSKKWKILRNMTNGPTPRRLTVALRPPPHDGVEAQKPRSDALELDYDGSPQLYQSLCAFFFSSPRIAYFCQWISWKQGHEYFLLIICDKNLSRVLTSTWGFPWVYQ